MPASTGHSHRGPAVVAGPRSSSEFICLGAGVLDKPIARSHGRQDGRRLGGPLLVLAESAVVQFEDLVQHFLGPVENADGGVEFDGDHHRTRARWLTLGWART